MPSSHGSLEPAWVPAPIKVLAYPTERRKSVPGLEPEDSLPTPPATPSKQKPPRWRAGLANGIPMLSLTGAQEPRVVLILLVAMWHLFTTVSVVSSKAFFNIGGSPLLLTMFTFAVGALPLVMQPRQALRMQHLLIPAACTHCCNTILTNYAVHKSSIRAVYTIKNMEPCLTAVFDQLLRAEGVSPKGALCLLAVPFLTFLAVQGDYTINALSAIAVLLSSAMVSCRTVLLKTAENSDGPSRPVTDFARMNLVSLGISMLFLPVGDVPWTQEAMSKMWSEDAVRLVAVACVCSLAYNFVSFRVLKRMSTIGHSLNNVAKRAVSIMAGVLQSGQQISPMNVLALAGLGGASYLWSREKAAAKLRAAEEAGKSPKTSRFTLDTPRADGRGLGTQLMLVYGTLIAAVFTAHLLQNDTLARLPKAVSPREVDTDYAQGCARYLATTLPVSAWHPSAAGEKMNFGDAIGPAVVMRMLGRRAPEEVLYRPGPEHRPALLAGGSLLAPYAGNCDVVWGNGWKGDHGGKTPPLRQMDFRAVRGPITRRYLLSLDPSLRIPEVYGDPALLLPTYFPEFKVRPFRSLRDNPIVVLHGNDADKLPTSTRYSIVQAMTSDWQDVVSQIVGASFVVSSSLHALMVADAFGIPNRALMLSLSEPKMKFTDYYLGTGRQTPQFAMSIEDAFFLGPEAPMIFDRQAFTKALPVSHLTLGRR